MPKAVVFTAAEFYDNNQVNEDGLFPFVGVAVPTAADIAAYIDGYQTDPIVTSPFLDTPFLPGFGGAGLVTGVTVFSSVEVTGGGVDAAPITGASVISATELFSGIDARTETAASVISSVNSTDYLDAATVRATFVDSDIQSISTIDTGIVTGSSNLSSVEVHFYLDSATETVSLGSVLSAVDTAQHTESFTLTAHPAIQSPSETAQFLDGTKVLEPSFDLFPGPSVIPEDFPLEVSNSLLLEPWLTIGTDTGVIVFGQAQLSATESYTSGAGGTAYNDAATLTVHQSISGVDIRQFIDAATLTESPAISSVNGTTYTPDSATITAHSVPSASVEIHTTTDAGTVTTFYPTPLLPGAESPPQLPGGVTWVEQFNGLDAATETVSTAAISAIESYSYVDAATITGNSGSVISASELYPTLINDHFNSRTVSSSWGSPDFSIQGDPYTLLHGTASHLSVSGGKGAIGPVTTSFDMIATDLAGTIQDANMFATMQWDVNNTDTNNYVEIGTLFARTIDQNNRMELRVTQLRSATNAPISLAFRTVVGGTANVWQTVAATVTSAINTNYNARFIVQGQGTGVSPITVLGTFWQTGTTEPSPQISFTDSSGTVPQFTGTTLNWGIRTGKVTGVTVSPTMSYNSLLVTTYP